MAAQGYVCHICGKVHKGPPLSYGAAAPAQWYGVPERERKKRTRLSSDQCEIDSQFFYVLGNIDIPLLGAPGVFQWSVWVSLSQANYERMRKLWNKRGRELEPPYFGWLSTVLPVYPPTLSLKTHVHTLPVGVRPFIELEPTDHPLAVEQRTGITMQRVRQIADVLLHQE